MYMTKQDVIQLRCDYTKHYVVKLKTHYKGLFKEIEKYNNCIQCDYEMSNSQKVYNWCYDIKKIQLVLLLVNSYSLFQTSGNIESMVKGVFYL